jgi:type II secretory pathway component PulK
VALGLVAVVGAAAVALAASTRQSLDAVRVGRMRTAARLAAEGGVEAARAALARDPAWRGGPVGVGSAQAEVTVLPAEGRDLVVSSRGTVAPSGPHGATASHAVEAVLRPGGGLPAIVAWREPR